MNYSRLVKSLNTSASLLDYSFLAPLLRASPSPGGQGAGQRGQQLWRDSCAALCSHGCLKRTTNGGGVVSYRGLLVLLYGEMCGEGEAKEDRVDHKRQKKQKQAHVKGEVRVEVKGMLNRIVSDGEFVIDDDMFLKLVDVMCEELSLSSSSSSSSPLCGFQEYFRWILSQAAAEGKAVEEKESSSASEDVAELVHKSRKKFICDNDIMFMLHVMGEIHVSQRMRKRGHRKEVGEGGREMKSTEKRERAQSTPKEEYDKDLGELYKKWMEGLRSVLSFVRKEGSCLPSIESFLGRVEAVNSSNGESMSALLTGGNGDVCKEEAMNAATKVSMEFLISLLVVLKELLSGKGDLCAARGGLLVSSGTPAGSLPVYSCVSALSRKQWAQLYRLEGILDREYGMRRAMLLKRLTVTLQSFAWSSLFKKDVSRGKKLRAHTYKLASELIGDGKRKMSVSSGNANHNDDIAVLDKLMEQSSRKRQCEWQLRSRVHEIEAISEQELENGLLGETSVLPTHSTNNTEEGCQLSSSSGAYQTNADAKYKALMSMKVPDRGGRPTELNKRQLNNKRAGFAGGRNSNAYNSNNSRRRSSGGEGGNNGQMNSDVGGNNGSSMRKRLNSLKLREDQETRKVVARKGTNADASSGGGCSDEGGDLRNLLRDGNKGEGLGGANSGSVQQQPPKGKKDKRKHWRGKKGGGGRGGGDN
eukprot:Nk52_evm53s485 gene=Nk52_evmTU53s485